MGYSQSRAEVLSSIGLGGLLPPGAVAARGAEVLDHRANVRKALLETRDMVLE